MKTLSLIRVELKEHIATPVAKAIYSDGSRLIVSCRLAWELAYRYQVPAVRVVDWSA